MRVLLVTSSARGHALAEALARSSHKPEIVAVSPQRNPGIRALAHRQETHDIMDFTFVRELGKSMACEFAVIGPDDPIGGGLADVLEDAGIPTIAPRKSLARVESSKGFTRDLLRKYLPEASPKYKVCISESDLDIEKYIEQELHSQYVVKYDGLRGGKGVKVSGEHLENVAEGVRYARECIAEGGRVVLEEKLVGVEFSLMSFVSGSRVVHMPAIQDHKRAFAADTGPNTGGMGTYSCADHSLPFLSPADLQAAKDINVKVAEALERECGLPYRGILYGGFIAVRSGVKVIEYNARFGDPEALNVLSVLESDFVDLCRSMIEGNLTDDMARFSKLATVCKYITPKSYPDAKLEKGAAVTFPAMPQNAKLYYGDLAESDDGTFTLGGSRTAGIIGIGSTLNEAEKVAQELCSKVTGPVRFRSDIGTETLVNLRSEVLNSLRS